MERLQALLERTLTPSESAPGAVALIARGDSIEVAAVGSVDVEGSAAMRRDSLFRIASCSKPIIAAAMMVLIDDGLIGLNDPIHRWLPELTDLTVVRAPDAPVDDVVPAARPITVEDVLSSRAGWGFPTDFDLPAVGLLFSELHQGSALIQPVPAPDDWLQILGRIPLLHQPGEAWLYNLCSDLQGVLIARVAGQSLPDFLTDRLFAPLGMTDTGFTVPAAKIDRFTSFYTAKDAGLELLDRPDGPWSTPQAFPSGAGGLVSTVDDWAAFGRMLLHNGSTPDGRQILSADSVRLMTTNHLTTEQARDGGLFLEGQGWGFGGSVDIAEAEPWTELGRYGWVGGTGTTAHIIPSSNTVAVLFTQLELNSPTPPAVMREFWTLASDPG